MKYNFLNPNRKTLVWSTCEFKFDDSKLDRTINSPVISLPRVNVENNSPIVNHEFPDYLFAVIRSSTSSKDQVIINKIIKPEGCKEIVLVENYKDDYGDAQTATLKITFDPPEIPLRAVINLSAGETETESAEIQIHLYANSKSFHGFEFKPHELQVNGSNFLVSKGDYLERSRPMYVATMYNSVEEYGHFSLARSGAKYFIGEYKKEKRKDENSQL